MKTLAPESNCFLAHLAIDFQLPLPPEVWILYTFPSFFPHSWSIMLLIINKGKGKRQEGKEKYDKLNIQRCILSLFFSWKTYQKIIFLSRISIAEMQTLSPFFNCKTKQYLQFFESISCINHVQCLFRVHWIPLSYAINGEFCFISWQLRSLALQLHIEHIALL